MRDFNGLCMPIYVAEFLKSSNLQTKFPKFTQLLYDLNLSSPINSIELQPPYKYDNYRYDPTEVFSSRILKGILDDLFNTKYGLLPDIDAQLNIIKASAPGINTANKFQHLNSLFHLITNAVRFNIIKTGNCVERAAYAAIVLKEIFAGTKMKVSLQGMKSIDHVAILFGPHKGKYYVFDPFINPEIFIEHAEFQENIASLFPKVDINMPSMKIEITRGIYSYYNTEKDNVRDKIIQNIQETTVDKLWATDKFQSILVSHGYTREHIIQAKEILDIACSRQTYAQGLNK